MSKLLGSKVKEDFYRVSSSMFTKPETLPSFLKLIV